MAETSKSGATGDRILLGLLFMAIAMLIMPARDGLAKYMSSSLPVFTIAWGTYCAAAIIVTPIAIRIHGREAILPNGLFSQTLRSLLLVASITTFFFSLRSVSLANAISAYFIGPFFATALAPLVLGERLTWPVILAVGFGFLGVLVALQPDGDFDANILWAVATGLIYALYMLATRVAAGQTAPLASLSYQSLVGVLTLAPLAFVAGIGGMEAFLGLFALIGIVQGASHAMFILAFRLAPASILAPLVYLEIVASVAIGIVAFGDWPGMHTWFGIAIIIGAGCIVALGRE